MLLVSLPVFACSGRRGRRPDRLTTLKGIVMTNNDSLSADLFRRYDQAFEAAQDQKKADLKAAASAHRQEQVDALLGRRISDDEWATLMAQARKAAEHGEKEFLLLRFPSDLCTDDSRAINNPPNDTWPETLRGEAADIYQRWDTLLRPHGFHISARVLTFPDGIPGDVGLFLSWVG